MRQKILYPLLALSVLSACGGGGGSSSGTPTPTPTPAAPTPTPTPAAPTPTPTPAAPTPTPTPAAPTPTPTPAAPTPTPTPTPSAALTFAEIQSDILVPNCTFAGCHVGGSAPEGLRFDIDAQSSFGSLVNVDAMQFDGAVRVIPNDAQNSYLIRKLEGRDINGLQMPRFRTPLATSVIQQIRDWIDNGAPATGTGVLAAKPNLDKTDVDEDGALLVVHYSKPLDENSFSDGAVQVYSVESNVDTLIDSEYVAVTFAEQSISISIDANVINSIQAEMLKIIVNDPSTSALVDVDGRSIDGDFDGIAGGATEYVIDL